MKKLKLIYPYHRMDYTIHADQPGHTVMNPPNSPPVIENADHVNRIEFRFKLTDGLKRYEDIKFICDFSGAHKRLIENGVTVGYEVDVSHISMAASGTYSCGVEVYEYDSIRFELAEFRIFTDEGWKYYGADLLLPFLDISFVNPQFAVPSGSPTPVLFAPSPPFQWTADTQTIRVDIPTAPAFVSLDAPDGLRCYAYIDGALSARGKYVSDTLTVSDKTISWKLSYGAMDTLHWRSGWVSGLRVRPYVSIKTVSTNAAYQPPMTPIYGTVFDIAIPPLPVIDGKEGKWFFYRPKNALMPPDYGISSINPYHTHSFQEWVVAQCEQDPNLMLIAIWGNPEDVYPTMDKVFIGNAYYMSAPETVTRCSLFFKGEDAIFPAYEIYRKTEGRSGIV